MSIAIDKKTSKLLKMLEKKYKCRIEHGKHGKNKAMVLPPNGLTPYLLHIGHKNMGDKAYHPLRRWANNTFDLNLV